MNAMAAACLIALLAQPDTSLDEFLAKFSEARKSTVSIEAAFEQKSVLPDETLSTKGSLVYSRPRSILFRTQNPEVLTVVHQSRFYEYEPGIAQCLVYDTVDAGAPEHMAADTMSLDVFFLAFESDTSRLREHYDLSLFTSDDPKGRRGLTIKPKAEYKDSAPFEEASLYLRDNDYLPFRVRIVTDKDSQVLIEVQELSVSDKAAPDKVQATLPEGTTLLLNDKVLETVGKDGRQIPLPVDQDPGNTPSASAPSAPLVEVKPLPAPEGAKQP